MVLELPLAEDYLEQSYVVWDLHPPSLCYSCSVQYLQNSVAKASVTLPPHSPLMSSKQHCHCFVERQCDHLEISPSLSLLPPFLPRKYSLRMTFKNMIQKSNPASARTHQVSRDSLGVSLKKYILCVNRTLFLSVGRLSGLLPPSLVHSWSNIHILHIYTRIT